MFLNEKKRKFTKNKVEVKKKYASHSAGSHSWDNGPKFN